MNPLARAALPALLLPLGLAACAGERDNGYPSLAKRPVEARGFDEPAAPPPAPVRPDPALDRMIAAQTAQLQTVRAGFDRDAARAERAAAAARGTAVGSDAWLEAQTALAQLDDWRAQATAIASDAEGRGADRAATLAPDYPALTALQRDAAAEAARQDALIRRLSASLPAA